MASENSSSNSNIIRDQLEAKVHEEVDMKLNVMKSCWMMDMYEYFKSKPSIIVNVFKEAGICDILED